MNILYMLNHKTLTDFEVPILNRAGYGVFIPKLYNSLSGAHSINHDTVNFYDNLIHIPPEDLLVLNRVDWFSNKVISQDVMDIVNNNFKYIFLTLLTDAPLIFQLNNHFNGKIYYRLFGLDGNKSYRDHVKKSSKIQYIFSYPEIFQYENKISGFFKADNSHVVPLGLSNSKILSLNGIYDRKNDKIAFVCSRINPKCKYYYTIYQNFIRDFKDFDYIIFGKNALGGGSVRNNLPDEEFYSSIAQCACMYYHGIEPRHLHYHPLEAIVMGIPIVFHQESLLSSFLPNSPGRSKNIQMCKDSISRIIKRDQEFIDEILREQRKGYPLLLQQNNTHIFDKILK